MLMGAEPGAAKADLQITEPFAWALVLCSRRGDRLGYQPSITPIAYYGT